MKSIILIGALLIIAGCAATELTTEGQRVRITNTEPGVDCEFLGVVTGSQGSALTGGLTSNENMETGALNDLRNKAAELGGNLILILTQRAGQTTGKDGAGTQTNVTMTANVYRCPK
jgi:hypothetical protein